MMRIVALNEDSQNTSDDSEPQVTKEAEETIAVSEYMRALKFKQNGKIDDALFLFLELLETQVLHEVTCDHKDNKLFSVKYNCYRNIGFIYEEKKEDMLSLTHLVKAMELDDTDVYTMGKLGQLALTMNKIEIAKIAFEKCLIRNPNHWPSIDGILQILCLMGSINDAYGWALHWYKEDNTYERAAQVLMEICDRFSDNLTFFENNWGGAFKPDEAVHKRNKESCFPARSVLETVDDHKPLKINYNEFKIEKLDWLSIGKLILKLYQYLLDNDFSLCSSFLLDDFFPSSHPEIVEPVIVPEIINVEMQSLTRTNSLETVNTNGTISKPVSEDGESQLLETNLDVVVSEFLSPTDENIVSQIPDAEEKVEKTDEIMIEQKPKARRRGSELSILEQWGWHKNRRSSRKKSVQPDQNEAIDTSINGFLKRMFPQYFSETFDTTQTPFIDESCDLVNKANSNKTKLKENPSSTEVTLEQFQELTESSFNTFLDELKVSRFDIFIPILKWLEKLSPYWNTFIPSELCKIYLNIYLLYLNHYDLHTWSIMEEQEFRSAYSMMLFYVELEYQHIVTASDRTNFKVPTELRTQIFHLTAFSGFSHSSNDIEHLKTILRLIWLKHNVALLEYDLSEAIACISKVEELLSTENPELEIYLPNQQINQFFNLEIIKNSKISLKRKFSLNNVKNLYEKNKYDELIVILKDSLINSTELSTPDNTTIKIQIQFEVLLESLWYLEQFEDCLIWAERCLTYSLENFLALPNESYRQKEWAESINFILIYIESLLLQETNSLLFCLENYLGRLVQNLTKIVVHQLDSPFDKNNTQCHQINLKMPWIIIYQILQKEEDSVKKKDKAIAENSEEADIEDSIPNTFMLFFTAHDFLGRKLWCSKDNGQFLLYALGIIAPQIRAPILEPIRECVTEYVEQITYCLYGYPAKKARSRHIEEHDTTQIELTWERAVQLFDIYRPDNLPEFNSYKLESITAEMEQLLQKILLLVPKKLDPTPLSTDLRNFINGITTELPNDIVILPSRIACIYYLLADYYFKNRDFSKTIKFYILDLTMNPTRFDSWAGLALSKATKLETKLNSCNPINSNDIFTQSEDSLRCFEQCVKLYRKQTLLWIEYGSFAYTIHAFCSRNLKQYSDTLSMEKFAFVEERKEECIKIAYNCFQTISKELSGEECLIQNSEDDQHDERWLYHYMLGKISEKKKEAPSVFLQHYLQSAKCLYENNATYPFKINHSNPQNLSIEALEIYYRISASIIKYLEQHSVVQREVGKLFNRVLKELASSPFALNQAKIDDSSLNALKRKLAQTAEENNAKVVKIDTPVVKSDEEIQEMKEKTNEIGDTDVEKVISVSPEIETVPLITEQEFPIDQTKDIPTEKIQIDSDGKKDTPLSPSRRGSQESNATTTTSTTTTTGGSSSTSSSTSSSSSGSDSSSSDSDSDSSSDDENMKDVPFTDQELEHIYKCCIKNFEECVTRFPEHYKSVYRLVNHYLNAPDKQKNFDKSKQLLLGTYTTSLGNKLQGLFIERKNNNFFNGIWRIPSSEIDRPGSFSSHLSKCVVILMEILKTSLDYNVLLDLALQLQRTPEPDKRYLKDSERKELFQQAISFCIQSLRSLLKKHSVDQRNDGELINLLLDIYKAHRKCFKHIQHKESLFSSLIVDTYKAYVKDKFKIPDNVNVFDYAVKLCQHEITIRKNQEKQGIPIGSHIIQLPIDLPIILPTQITKTNSSPGTFSTPPTTTSATPTFTPNSTPTPTPTQSPVATVIPQIQIIPTVTTTSAAILGTTLSATTSATLAATSAITTVKPSTNFSSSLPRPRGRPVGSKNSNPPSLLNSGINMGNPYMDSATMAAMLTMYSNPNIMQQMSQFKDSNMMSSLLAEYYSKLGFSSNAFASLSNMSSLLGNSSVNLMGQQQQQPQQQQQHIIQSPKVSPQIESKKNMPSSLKATINIGSQLTITPSPPIITHQMKDQISKLNLPETTRVTGSKLSSKDKSTNHQQQQHSLPSILKKDLTNQNFTTKILQDMNAGIPTSNPHLTTMSSSLASAKNVQYQNFPHDLPKSLTITPTTSTATYSERVDNIDKKVNQNQTSNVNKYSTGGKVKNVKKSNAPYNRGGATKAAIQQSQFAGLAGYSVEEYKRHMALISSYADALQRNNSMVMNPAATSTSTSIGKSSKQSTYKKQTQKSHQQQQQQTRSPSGFINSPSPIPAHSPTKSPVLGINMPRQTMTPPSITSGQTSTTKTLQQKLAEQKQKANASSISNTTNYPIKTASTTQSHNKKQENKRKQMLSSNNDDVIILE